MAARILRSTVKVHPALVSVGARGQTDTFV